MWQEIEFLGAPNRPGCERALRVGADVDVEVGGNVLPPHSYQVSGTDYWFVAMKLTQLLRPVDDMMLALPDALKSKLVWRDNNDPKTFYSGILEDGTQIILGFGGDLLAHFLVNCQDQKPQPREEA